MDIISEIGVLENTLLQCNISKNKVLMWDYLDSE
jgi:hypothetical protein